VDRPSEVTGAEVILWVSSQERSRAFWRIALGLEPVLDVAGMTAFDLDGLRLGLMPREDIGALLGPAVLHGDAAPDSELYLLVRDVETAFERLLAAGASPVALPAPRPWGDVAGYALDPDGHVIAVASRPSPPEP
jgi:uncharacterized protein